MTQHTQLHAAYSFIGYTAVINNFIMTVIVSGILLIKQQSVTNNFIKTIIVSGILLIKQHSQLQTILSWLLLYQVK